MRIVIILTEQQKHIVLRIKHLILRIHIVWKKKIPILSTVIIREYILNEILKNIGMMDKTKFRMKCMILREIF